MKGLKSIIVILCAAVTFGSCNYTQKGAAIGAGTGIAAGTGIGAGIGALVGGKHGAKLGAMIGAAAGGAVGTTAGALIGRKMDKAKKAAAAIAQAETFTDANGLEGVKVTFDNGILFKVGKSDLQAGAQNTLSQFAKDVLNVYTDCDVNIYGFASSDGDEAKNQTLSEARATSVSGYLKNNCGVAAKQIRTVKGFGENPEYLVLDANGKENLAASRRVEVYLYASQEMIKAAEAGTLK